MILSAFKKILAWITKIVDCIDIVLWTAVRYALLLAIVITGARFFSPSAVTEVPENSIVVIDLAGRVRESAAQPVGVPGIGSARENVTVLADVLDTFRTAAGDKSVSGIYLKVDDLSGIGLASIREIGVAMDKFKETGKRITVWAPAFNQSQYAVAAHASEVFVHPMGEVFIKGLASKRLYWGEALRDAGVTVHVFKAGDYKSFPEPFVRKNASRESIEADRSWLESEWSQMLQNMEQARGLMPGSIQRMIDSYPEELAKADGDMSQLALSNNLVDGVKTIDEVLLLLAQRQGLKDAEEPVSIDMFEYLGARPATPGQGKGVAVVTIEGEIVEGPGKRGSAGSDDICADLIAARTENDVGAVVLRINSPGGSALASEMIRREIELVKKAGKPVVASFGDTAASGGYWIGSGADRIISDPMTLTGSIGVFGIMPTFDKVLDKFNVGRDGVATTWIADSSGFAAPIGKRHARMMEMKVGRTYRDFVDLVAKSRSMKVSDVERIAQGRVYTGAQAQKLGLVDSLGGISQAVNEARSLAKLDEKSPVYHYEPEASPMMLLARKVFDSVGVDAGSINDVLGVFGLRAVAELADDPVAGAVLRAAETGRSELEVMAHCQCSVQ